MAIKRNRGILLLANLRLIRQLMKDGFILITANTSQPTIALIDTGYIPRIGARPIRQAAFQEMG